MVHGPVQRISVLSLLVIGGVSLGAQTPETTHPPAAETLELELLELLNTPVMGASKREQRLLDSPQAIEVLTGDEIRMMGVYRIQDALKLMTSVDVLEGDLGYSVVGMRGVMQDGQPRTVQVLIDGVPLYMPMGGPGIDISTIPVPLDLIERIEVVRGPSSTLYGANAVAGVIAISTKKLDPGLHGDLRASGADKSTTRSAGNLRWSEKGFGLVAGYTGASFGNSDYRTHQVGFTQPYPYSLGGSVDPWITFDGENAPGHQTDKAHQSSAYARAEYRSEASSFWLSSGRSRKMLSPVGQPLVSFTNYRFYDINTFLAGWSQAWSKTFSTEVRVHRMQNQIGFGPSPNLAVVFSDPAWAGNNTWADLTSDQIDLQANWNPSDVLHFVLGADTRKMRFGKDVMHGILDEAKESASGTFASMDWSLAPAHSVSLGFRAENESLGGSRVSPRAIYVWNVGKSSTLRFAYLTSSRSPQYLEQRIDFTVKAPIAPYPSVVRILPNPELKAEKTSNFEVGYRQILGALTLDATAYQMKFSNLITSETVGIFTYPSPPYPAGLRRVDSQFQNTGDATNTGLELAATWHLQKGWTLGGNLGYVDFKKDNPKPTDPLGSKFAYTSGLKVNAWTRLTYGGWFGYVGLQYTGATDVEALQIYGQPLYDKRDAILQYHLNLGYEFLKGLSGSLYVRNGAKEFTEQGATGPDRPTYYLAARREIGATATYRF